MNRLPEDPSVLRSYLPSLYVYEIKQILKKCGDNTHGLKRVLVEKLLKIYDDDPTLVKSVLQTVKTHLCLSSPPAASSTTTNVNNNVNRPPITTTTNNLTATAIITNALATCYKNLSSSNSNATFQIGCGMKRAPASLKFPKPLFYEVTQEVLPPMYLNNGIDKFHRNIVKFSIQPKIQKHEKLLLRFCCIENYEVKLCRPPIIVSFTVNYQDHSNMFWGASRTKTEPFDISDFRNLKDIKLEFNWSPYIQCKKIPSYAIQIIVAKQSDASEIMMRITHADKSITEKMISQKLTYHPSHGDVTTTSVRLSLNCPISKIRIRTPGNATTCSHIQCFDLECFLEMNRKRESWKCPVCNKPVVLENLVIDGLFEEILQQANCEEIVFEEGLNWKPSVKRRNEKQNTSVIDIDSYVPKEPSPDGDKLSQECIVLSDSPVPKKPKATLIDCPEQVDLDTYEVRIPSDVIDLTYIEDSPTYNNCKIADDDGDCFFILLHHEEAIYQLHIGSGQVPKLLLIESIKKNRKKCNPNLNRQLYSLEVIQSDHSRKSHDSCKAEKADDILLKPRAKNDIRNFFKPVQK